MNIKYKFTWFCRLLILTFILHSPKVFAVMGERWELAQLMFSPATKITKNPYFSEGYTVYIYEKDPNLLIREYVNSSGVVFAVSWSGVYLPSFESLLLSKYIKIIKEFEAPFNSKLISFNRDGFYFVNSGRMRSFNGYAYDIHLIPSKFDLNSLQ